MNRIIRGANWYFNDVNMRLNAAMATLPELTRAMTPYVLGGGKFGIELPDEINPLVSTMDVNGVPEGVRGRFGREPGDWTTVTYYEALLNVFPDQTANADQNASVVSLTGRVVIMKGLLNGITYPAVSGKAEGPTRLTWSTIVLYHDIMDGQTTHKLDVRNNTLIIEGVNYTAEHNRLVAA